MGVLVIAAFYMVLNEKRFGSILEFGHNYLPEFTRTETGQFHLSYLAENLKLLFRLPQAGENSGSLYFFTSNGMAFWLVTPFFLTMAAAWGYGMVKKRKEYLPVLLFLPLLTVVHVLFLCCHKTLGGWHFGNRYLMDFLPYLFVGFLLWKPRDKSFDQCNVPLFMLGSALNLIGTVATYNAWNIIPARYLNSSDPAELATHCMEDIDKEFVNRVNKGDIIVAAKNFGCGSSREHAPIAIKASGVSCVIAETFARIFYRNAINIGLPIIECKEASERIEAGDEVEIDFDSGIITNKTKNESYQGQAFPEFMQKIIKAEGLMNYINAKG